MTDARRTLIDAAVAAGGASTVMLSFAVNGDEGGIRIAAGECLELLLRSALLAIQAAGPDPPPSRPTFNIRPIPPQPEAEKDWMVGDRAVCLRAGTHWYRANNGEPVAGPLKGQILRVIVVSVDSASVWLVFDAHFPCKFFPAGHFRKLRACSTDFREQLRKRTPAPVRALEDLPA